jgi:hypothetical protein
MFYSTKGVTMSYFIYYWRQKEVYLDEYHDREDFLTALRELDKKKTKILGTWAQYDVENDTSHPCWAPPKTEY